MVSQHTDLWKTCKRCTSVVVNLERKGCSQHYRTEQLNAVSQILKGCWDSLCKYFSPYSLVVLCVSCHRQSFLSFWMWKCPHIYFLCSHKHHWALEFGSWVRQREGDQTLSSQEMTEYLKAQRGGLPTSLTLPSEETPER